MDAEYLKECIEDRIINDDRFCNCFCHNCPDKVIDRNCGWQPSDEYCHCGELDITDAHCSRHGDWLKIVALVEQIVDIATETYRTERED